MSSDAPTSRSTGFGFSVFLVALIGLSVALSATYSPTSRLIPLVVGVPTLLILILVALSHVSAHARRITDRFDTALFAMDSELLDDDDEQELKPGGVRRGLGWLLALTAGYYLFGFVVATPFFVYGYLRGEGGHPRRQSVVLAIVTTVFLVGLFEIVLETWLYPGAAVLALENLLFSA